jgi:hypothetical protein
MVCIWERIEERERAGKEVITCGCHTGAKADETRDQGRRDIAALLAAIEHAGQPDLKIRNTVSCAAAKNADISATVEDRGGHSVIGCLESHALAKCGTDLHEASSPRDAKAQSDRKKPRRLWPGYCAEFFYSATASAVGSQSMLI